MAKHRQNPEIAAIQIPAAHNTEAQPREPMTEKETKDLIGLAAEVAQDTMYIRNTHWDNAEEYFPVDPIFRTVDKFFPHAAGGPLYVDQPETDSDIEVCKRKAEAMVKEGLRYCYISKDMDLVDIIKQMNSEDSLGVA
jgi:hypothetical protein